MENPKDASKEVLLESDEDPSYESAHFQREKRQSQPSHTRTGVENDDLLQQEPDSDEGDEDVRNGKKEVEDHEDDGLRFSGDITWPKFRTLMEAAYEEPVALHSSTPAGLSSSSSFHGDDITSESADHETDRSTSSESNRGKHTTNTAQSLPDSSEQHSAKLASQLAAARRRQNSDAAMQKPEESPIHQPSLQRSYVPLSVSSLRQRQVAQQPLPVIENLPLTGYELLATKLSSSGFEVDGGPRIKPIYRKFELLQHRLLLHLQDELSELENQLEQIDDADTKSRMIDRHIVPASRRAAAKIGGGLEYHKTDILGRIGFKLDQYNKALTSFKGIQSLSSPHLADIEDYRNYLHEEQPVTESETQFLDIEEDLVSIARRQEKRTRRYIRRADSFESSKMVPSIVSNSAVSSRTSTIHTRSIPHSRAPILPTTIPEINSEKVAVPRISLSVLACAISFTFLLPILFFLVIPGLLGRSIVTVLVTLGAAGGLLHAEIVSISVLLSQGSATCAALYGGVMIVIAVIVA